MTLVQNLKESLIVPISNVLVSVIQVIFDGFVLKVFLQIEGVLSSKLYLLLCL